MLMSYRLLMLLARHSEVLPGEMHEALVKFGSTDLTAAAYTEPDAWKAMRKTLTLFIVIAGVAVLASLPSGSEDILITETGL